MVGGHQSRPKFHTHKNGVFDSFEEEPPASRSWRHSGGKPGGAIRWFWGQAARLDLFKATQKGGSAQAFSPSFVLLFAQLFMALTVVFGWLWDGGGIAFALGIDKRLFALADRTPFSRRATIKTRVDEG